ncbi:hypothetical protein Nepgr_016644 [Nepenthes gracilis]|uniref:Uncharacterized protein n=1 Tax=Nepenthes gracilis TaxID=150966 RepID=A0AAD3XRT1_NEPGR|nr:hypothetical protein Nepgr_016644 [Nepenthes gracilis]
MRFSSSTFNTLSANALQKLQFNAPEQLRSIESLGFRTNWSHDIVRFISDYCYRIESTTAHTTAQPQIGNDDGRRRLKDESRLSFSPTHSRFLSSTYHHTPTNAKVKLTHVSQTVREQGKRALDRTATMEAVASEREEKQGTRGKWERERDGVGTKKQKRNIEKERASGGTPAFPGTDQETPLASAFVYKKIEKVGGLGEGRRGVLRRAAPPTADCNTQ